MSAITPTLQTGGRKPYRIFILLLTGALALMLAGCGSTKVYTADKTIVYGGSLYNMGNVQRISTRIDGKLPDGSTVKLSTLDKKGVEALLDQHGQLAATSYVEMDAQEMPYQQAGIKRYSDYDKLNKRLQGAMKDINKFMSDKKKTQLKLK